jgi:hypothetical protein
MIKDIDTLTPAPYNPRILEDHDGKSLEASIKRWGDISGVTKNVNSGYIVTGHQRIAILKKAFGKDRIKIQVEEQHEPDQHHTVAIGFVCVEGTNIKLNYREVALTPEEEKVMNIAANRIQGSFALDLLGEINHELSQLENGTDLLKLTGQTEDEISSLLKANGATGEDDQPKGDGAEHLNLRLSPEQLELINEAFGNAKTKIDNSQVASSSYDGLALELICREYLAHIHASAENTNVAQ